MLRCGFCFSLLVLASAVAGPRIHAQDEAAEKAADEASVELTDKWLVLLQPNRRAPGVRVIPEKSQIKNVKELAFTGPQPGHPFVIGDYQEEGDFGLVDGVLQPVSGKNSAIQLPTADQFELEGVMEHIEFGGWYLLVGWDEGRGYLVSNATMKESGSPWHVTEMRGSAAVPESSKQITKSEWLNSQPFKLLVKDAALTLEVGGKKVINQHAMDNYAAGQVVLGVYDTRYGPKKLRIRSLRMRSLAKAENGPETIADRLKQEINAEFKKTPLEKVVTSIGDSVGVKFVVDGNALKEKGYTRNMQQTLSLGKVPAIEALKAIVDVPNQSDLAIWVDEAAGQAVLTTKASLEKAGKKPLPLE
jgi:hypothetical protein